MHSISKRGSLKILVHSGQLWQIIYPQISAQTTQTELTKNLNKKKATKHAKNLLLVFAKDSIGVNKCLDKCKNICLVHIISKHYQN